MVSRTAGSMLQLKKGGLTRASLAKPSARGELVQAAVKSCSFEGRFFVVGLSCLLQRVLEFLSESARIVSLLLGTTRHVSSRRTAEECCLQLKRKVRRVVFFRVAGGLIQLRGKGRLFLLVWPCHPPPSPGSWSIVRDDRVWKAFFHWRLASHAHTSPVPPPRCTSTRPRDGCNALSTFNLSSPM